MSKKILTALMLMIGMMACSASDSKTATNATKDMDTTEKTDTASVKVEMKTSEGDVTLLLYGDTPKHRDNFVKLVKDGYYDGVLFHRVINNFMVQTGDPDSKNAAPGQRLGAGSPDYTIEAEIVYPKHFHKRGALAAARTGDQINPERRSSGSQFYIVTGEIVPAENLDMLQRHMEQQQLQDYFNKLVAENWTEIQRLQQAGDNEGLQQMQTRLQQETIDWGNKHPFTLPTEIKEAYTTVGGTPHLDNQYTVFGEVLSGMDVIDKIQKVETDGSDRPVNDVKVISMKVIE